MTAWYVCLVGVECATARNAALLVSLYVLQAEGVAKAGGKVEVFQMFGQENAGCLRIHLPAHVGFVRKLKVYALCKHFAKGRGLELRSAGAPPLPSTPQQLMRILGKVDQILNLYDTDVAPALGFRIELCVEAGTGTQDAPTVHDAVSRPLFTTDAVARAWEDFNRGDVGQLKTILDYLGAYGHRNASQLSMFAEGISLKLVEELLRIALGGAHYPDGFILRVAVPAENVVKTGRDMLSAARELLGVRNHESKLTETRLLCVTKLANVVG